MKNILNSKLFYYIVSILVSLSIGYNLRSIYDARHSHEPETIYSTDTVVVTQVDTVIRFVDKIRYVPTNPTIVSPVVYDPDIDTANFVKVFRVVKDKDIKVYTTTKMYTYKNCKRFRITLYNDKVYFYRYREFPVKWNGLKVGVSYSYFEKKPSVYLETGITFRRLDVKAKVTENKLLFETNLRLF